MLRHPLRFRREHRFTAEHASEYLDGDLDADGRARVDHHTRWCPECRALLASLRRTLAALGELGTPARPQGETALADGVIARLRADR